MRKQEDSIFHEIGRSFWSFRQLLQNSFNGEGLGITVDQWLIMRALKNNPDLNQGEIADIAGKDPASVTRIMDLLVKKGFIGKESLPGDRRRTVIQITEPGAEMLKHVKHTVRICEIKALKGIKEKRINKLGKVLNVITGNCGR